MLITIKAVKAMGCWKIAETFSCSLAGLTGQQNTGDDSAIDINYRQHFHAQPEAAAIRNVQVLLHQDAGSVVLP